MEDLTWGLKVTVMSLALKVAELENESKDSCLVVSDVTDAYKELIKAIKE